MQMVSQHGDMVKIEIGPGFLGVGFLTSLDQNLFKSCNSIELIFSENSMLTSEGIVDWSKWIQSLTVLRKDQPQKLPQFKLLQCPVSVTRQFDLLIHKNSESFLVESFFVPFFNEESNESKQILLKRGMHFTDNSIQIPNCLDSKGNAMELDVVPKVYFSFLKQLKSFPG